MRTFELQKLNDEKSTLNQKRALLSTSNYSSYTANDVWRLHVQLCGALGAFWSGWNFAQHWKETILLVWFYNNKVHRVGNHNIAPRTHAPHTAKKKIYRAPFDVMPMWTRYMTGYDGIPIHLYIVFYSSHSAANSSHARSPCSV